MGFIKLLGSVCMGLVFSSGLYAQSPIPGTTHKRGYLAAGDLNGDGFDDLVALTSHPDMPNNVFTSQLHWYLGNNVASRNYLDYMGVTGSTTLQYSSGRAFAKPVILEGTNGRGRVAVLTENAPVGAIPPYPHYQLKFLEIFECNVGCTQLTLRYSFPISIFGTPQGNTANYQFLSAHLFNSKQDYDQDGYEDLLIVWSEGDPTGQAISQWQQSPTAGVGVMGVSRLNYSRGFPGTQFVVWNTNVNLPPGAQVLDEAIGVGEVYQIGPQPNAIELAIGTSSRSILAPTPGLSMEHVTYDSNMGLIHQPSDRLAGFGNFIGLKTKTRDPVISTDFVEDFNTGFMVGGFIHPAFRSPITQFSQLAGNFGVQFRPSSSGFFPYGNVSGGIAGIYFENGDKMFAEATGDFFGDGTEEAVFAIRRYPNNGTLARSGPGATNTLVVAGITMAQQTPYLLETYPNPIVHMVSGDFNGDGYDDLVGSTGRWFHKFFSRVIPGRFTLWLGQANRSVGLVRAY